jgi:hypothetical protein
VPAQEPSSPVEIADPPAPLAARIAKALLLALWLGSLALPAAWTTDGHPDWNDGTGPTAGLGILLWGWAGILDGTIGWFANPLFLLFLCLRMDGGARRKRAAVFAVLFALTFVSALSWRVSYGADDLVTTPGGAGYVIWLIAISAATLWTAMAVFLGYRARG